MPATKPTTAQVRISPEVAARLVSYAKANGHSATWVATKAVEKFLERAKKS